MSDSRDLVDMIVKKVSRLFTEAECPEDDAVEKVFTQETGSC